MEYGKGEVPFNGKGLKLWINIVKIGVRRGFGCSGVMFMLDGDGGGIGVLVLFGGNHGEDSSTPTAP